MTDANQDAPEPLGATGYLAPEGFVDELVAELGEVSSVHGRLVFAPGPPRPAAWCHNIWIDPVRIPIASIKDGARRLKAIQRNWWPYAAGHFRRTELIQAQLPHVSAKPIVFPQPLPTAPLGSWTLLDPDTMVASACCTSPWPNGEPQFVEDRQAPPNRAYLKLWEAFSVTGRWPRPGERCLDMGASPGGWTWVLASLGADVTAVDKAPLDPRIAAMPNVRVRQESAFGLDPHDVGLVDWLCWDVICYPQRLRQLLDRWLAADTVRNLICTIKFQGPTDPAVVRDFQQIPGSTVRHLSQNKHELTWMRLTE